jgi:hypothetical protein
MRRVNIRPNLSENYTSGIVWRVRITAPPKPSEFDEYDVRRFRVGEIYEVPARLASLLILGGYAESTGSTIRAEAADRSDKNSKR